MKSDHFKQLITLTVTTLSSFLCFNCFIFLSVFAPIPLVYVGLKLLPSSASLPWKIILGCLCPVTGVFSVGSPISMFTQIICGHFISTIQYQFEKWTSILEVMAERKKAAHPGT
jgi:hypothetical protein